MEESVLDLVPQTSVGQTNLDKTFTSDGSTSDVEQEEQEEQPINVHLLEDTIDPVLERATTQDNTMPQTPRNPNLNLNHTSSDTYEHSQIIQNVHHDNAIDIVESDDEHLELKQSGHRKVQQDNSQDSKSSNLGQSVHTINQGKRKRDNTDNRVPKLQNRQQLRQEEARLNEPPNSIIDSESRPNTSMFTAELPKKLAEGIQNINGIVYNDRGYEICGHMNQHNKPCQRIGNCPFHGQSSAAKKQELTHSKSTIVDLREAEARVEDSSELGTKETDKEIQEITQESSSSDEVKLPESGTTYVVQNNDIPKLKKNETRSEGIQNESGFVKKVPFKQGWSREEHIRFLIGLSWYGKGAWKEISSVVVTRSPTQIQSHAQKYFLRQRQPSKNKKSIHDITMEDLQEMSADTKQAYLLQNQRQFQVPSGPPPVNQPAYAPPVQNNQKDPSPTVQPTPDFRPYSTNVPYPAQYPVHYQPQGPSTYQYSFPSGQSQLQVPVIPNPQPIPASNPVYPNNPSVYPPPMPYPQPAYPPQPPPPPPPVHYGYPQPPPPVYPPPPHMVPPNNTFPAPPVPNQPWQPPSYQMPGPYQQSQYNYVPNNPPAMPYPMNQNPAAPFPSYHANSNAMYSQPYIPQDANRNNAFTTNTNNMYPPNWTNPQIFSHMTPGEHSSFHDTEHKKKIEEDEKLQDENTLSENNLQEPHDSFDDQFAESAPGNNFEIADINDHHNQDIVPSFPEDTQKYLL